MAPPETADLVDLLPWALRRDAERYLAAVRENAREIFQQAGVPQTAERVEQLLLLAAVQKVWATVNTQTWIVESALGLIGQRQEDAVQAADVEGLRLGRATYSRTSEAYLGLRTLRADLDRTLRQLEIRDLVRKASLVALAQSLVDRKSRGR